MHINLICYSHNHASACGLSFGHSTTRPFATLTASLRPSASALYTLLRPSASDFSMPQFILGCSFRSQPRFAHSFDSRHSFKVKFMFFGRHFEKNGWIMIIFGLHMDDTKGKLNFKFRGIWLKNVFFINLKPLF